MKVKIGDDIIDGAKEPIMVILTQKDKDNIAAMAPEAEMYCEYPELEWGEERIRKWMREGTTTSHITDEIPKEK